MTSLKRQNLRYEKIFMDNVLPIQFLGGMLKGINEKRGLFSISSGRNLSGSNFSGSGQCMGFLCIKFIEMSNSLPWGITMSPTTYCNGPNSFDKLRILILK
jgi:hypothetical protein